MAQRLMVDLEFRANTDAAKKQIQNLQTTLNQAINSSMTGKNLGITPQLEKARLSALQLKTALDSATNVDTGKLNLHKFTNNLRNVGLNVQQLGKHLQMLGPDGVKAFNQMTSAMASAETRIFSLQGGMRRLVNTFANTVRYQASAYAIQAVTSSISEAITYTKDLNKALTDIQMVTSKSNEDMQRFAVQANKAAKSLSTTTTEYAKASQIYFQQGLDTGEAMKRAETTIKLAHATGDSMEEVSNWMTAIWNNFDNGTKTLEYYGDVLAKLGAATASSADEIATGLEKFAVVADTVGLSYEYAASALATITAETRQSAEVVGTALKTLFARIEGLKLGDTLEDGTDLNKYSAALQTVGVNIKDANGELKDMDMILDETAAKWNTLAKDEQVALAQSVAGVRQYSQFIALMDNYDVMQSNIEMSRKASGSLQEMHEKYENSIEGIQAKSKAAGESLIATLMDEDDIKGFYKAMTSIMEFTTKLTKAFGGLEGILMMAANALLKLYQPQIATSFQNMAYNIKDMGTSLGNMAKKNFNQIFGTNFQEKETYAVQQRRQAIEMSGAIQRNQIGGMADAGITEKINDLKIQLFNKEKNITEQQRQQYEWQIQLFEATRDTLVAEERRVEALKQINMEKGDAINASVREGGAEQRIATANTMSSALQAASAIDLTNGGDPNLLISKLKEARSAALELGIDIKDMGFEDAIGDAQLFAEQAGGDFDTLKAKIEQLNQALQKRAAYERSSATASGLEINTAAIQNRSGALGAMEYSTEATVGLAKNAVGVDLTAEGKKQLGQQLTTSLQETQAQAEKLGMNIKDLGFDDAMNDIKRFAEQGEIDLNKLIAKLEEFQSKMRNGVQGELNATVEDAAVGAVLGKEAASGLSELSNIDGTKSSDEQAKQAISGASKMGGNKTDNMKTSEAVLQNLQKRRAEVEEKFQERVKAAAGDEKKLEIAQKKRNAAIDSISKSEKKHIGILQDEAKQVKNSIKQSGTYKDVMEQRGEAMREAAESSKDLGKEEAALQGKVNNTKNSIEQMQGSLEKGAQGIKNFGTGLTSFLSSAMSVATGMNMLKNGVASLSEAIGSGKAGFDDYLTSAMSILPGLMQMLPVIMSVTSAVYAKVGAWALARKQSKITADQEVNDSNREATANIMEGMSEVAADAGKGPAGWAIAAASLVAVGSIAAMIGIPIAMGISQGREQQKEAELEEEREVTSAASEVGKSLTSLNESADKFKELRENGKSTTSVLEDMSAAVKDVSFQIDELVKKADGNTNWEFLTGLKMQLLDAQKDLEDGIIDIDQYKAFIANAQAQVAQQQVRQTYNTAVKSGWAEEDKTTYLTTVGTMVSGNENLLEQAEEEFLSKVDSYKDSEEAKKAWGTAMIHAAGISEDYAESPEAISTLLSYATPEVYRTINGLSLFDEHGSVSNQVGYGSTKYEAIKTWFKENPDALAYADNFEFASDENLDNQYQNILDKQEIAKINLKADNLGYNTDAFEIYTDLLTEVNDELSTSELTAKKVALENLKLNKGLVGLADDWDDLSTVIHNGAVGSLEYSEALVTLQTKMEEAFGVKFDADFLRENFNLVENAVNGDINSLQQLQNKMAEEYMVNLEYKYAEDGVSKSPQEIQDTLYGILNTLSDPKYANFTPGQDIDLGAFEMAMAEMIKSGQRTKEELLQLLSLKGFSFEVDADNNITKIYKTTDYDSINKSLQETLKEKRKKIEADTNVYYKQEQALKRIEKAYSELERAKSRAYGQKYLDYLTQEAGLIAAESNNLSEQATIADGQIDKYRKKLEALGAVFDENGTMLNYAAMMEYFNKNAATTEEEYEKFTEAMSNYEKSMDKATEVSNQIGENANKILDLKLEAIDYQVNIKLNLADEEIKYLEYQLENLYDPAIKAAEAVGLIGQKMGASADKIGEARRGIELVLDVMDVNTSFDKGQIEEMLAAGDISFLDGVELDQQSIEKLREYQSILLEENKALKESMQEIFSVVEEEMEAWSEQFDRIGSKIEHQTSILETYKNIADLVGRDKLDVSTEMMSKMVQQQVKNSQLLLKTNKENLDVQKQNLENLKAEREAALEGVTDEDEIARINADWEDVITAAEDKVQELEQTVNDSWVSSLETAAEAFEYGVQLAVEEFEKAMTGIYGTFENLNSILEQMATESERYLPDYTKIYELSKLNREISKSIDSTQSIKGAQELAKIQAEISKLQKSDAKVSKYELENLRKKYDLKLAEIALEEAQKTKSQVRMRRDSEGNWGYVYTANETAIANAQQGLEDAMYSYSSFTQEEIDRLQESIITAPQKAAEEIAALDPNSATFAEDRARITQFWSDQAAYWTDQLNMALRNASKFYTDDWTAYGELIGYKISKDEEWVDCWEETQAAQILGFKTLEDWYHNFAYELQDFNTKVEKEYETYQMNIEYTMEAAGTAMEDFGTTTEEAMNKASTAISNLEKQLLGGDGQESLATKATNAFKTMADNVHDAYDYYEQMTEDYIKRNEKIYTGLQKVFDLYDDTTGDVGEGYYGTITIDRQTYRSTEKFDTEKEAQEWATKTASQYQKQANDYNKAAGVPYYDVRSIKGGTISALDGMGMEETPGIKKYTNSSAPSSTPGGSGRTQIKASDVITPDIDSIAYGAGYKDSYYRYGHSYYKLDDSIGAKQDSQGNWSIDTNKLTSATAIDFIKDIQNQATTILNEQYIKLDDGLYYKIPDDPHKITQAYDDSYVYLKPYGAKRDEYETLFNYYKPSGSNSWYKMNAMHDNSIISLYKNTYTEQEVKEDMLQNKSTIHFKLDSELTDSDVVRYMYDNSKFVALGNQNGDGLSTGYYLWERSNADGSYGSLYYSNSYGGKNGKVELVQRNWLGADKYDDYFNFQELYSKNKMTLSSFNTGGYTGEWDSSGRLAMLHQKEIVLNAHDTENFLAAVNIVRDIAKTIDLQALSYQHQLAQLSYVNAGRGTPQTVQQEVTIRAEFPNATDRYEIEAAFASLVNDAAQFANRKK